MNNKDIQRSRLIGKIANLDIRQECDMQRYHMFIISIEEIRNWKKDYTILENFIISSKLPTVDN